MSRQGYNRTTAERMRDRRASLGYNPPTPAVGFMPFAGHRSMDQIKPDLRKDDRKPRAYGYEG